MSYLAEAFYPPTLEAAKNVALTFDPNDPGKFESETTYLVEFLEGHRLLGPAERVLDFGCGMGRVAKALIERAGCRVVGTDMSAAMRHFAERYVASELFEVHELPPEGPFDLVLSILVLQHTQYPDIEIERLHDALRVGGTLVVLNESKRLVPSGVDAEGYVRWDDDGVSVDALLQRRFELVGRFAYPGRTDQPLSIWKKV